MDAVDIEPCVSVRGCDLRTRSLGLDGDDVCGDQTFQHFSQERSHSL